MHCIDARLRLQEFVDGQLPVGEATSVQDHLERCAKCEQEVALLRQVDEALATQAVLEEPARFTARVVARVRAVSVSPPAFRLHWEDVLVSLVFASTMVTVLSVFSQWHPGVLSTIKVVVNPQSWTWLSRLGELECAAQAEPLYGAWLLSSLCVAALAAASAIVLLRQWPGRPMPASRRG